MDATTKSYIESQLLKAQAMPLKDGEFVRLQIVGNSGKTNFINVSAEQLRAIESILLGDAQ